MGARERTGTSGCRVSEAPGPAGLPGRRQMIRNKRDALDDAYLT